MRITSAGIRYSNIEPDQERSAEPRLTGVKARPRSEPMRRRDIALGDGDKTGQTGFRSQHIVATFV